VSGSALSDHTAVARRGSSWPIAALAAAFFLAHLPFLSPSLEDIDSINFALGLHDFDPALHQPHPPGYPVYIALGRVTRAALATIAPSMDAVRLDARALAIWSALGGAVAVVAAWALVAAIAAAARRPGGGPLPSRGATADAVRDAPRQGDSRPGERGPIEPRHLEPPGQPGNSAIAAAALLAVAPLFWLSALRPMSDMPGLAAALCAQALLVHGVSRPRRFVMGACLAGLAAGIRVQSLALTMPLLLVVWAWPGSRSRTVRTAAAAGAALMAGVLLWAVPLLVASGGVSGYMRALGSQAGEDFAWVDMLWSNPTARRLALSLRESFLLPWASDRLGLVMGVLALIGAGLVLLRDRRAAWLLAAAFLPYAAFHLLLQETATVRYALPLLVPVAWLAARAAASAGRLAPLVSLGLVVSAAAESVPAAIEYGRDAHPAFRAIAQMRQEAEGAPPEAVYAHYALYRPLQAVPPGAFRVVPPVRSLEWLGPARYWLEGGTRTVWFLADPRRTDLALIDPASVRREEPFVWSVAERPELKGSRPLGVDWYRITPPGWFAGEGWSLTPETGGLARATATGLAQRPIDAYVRRRPGPAVMMLGGFHLGPDSDPPAALQVALDDRVVDTWTFAATAAEPSFLRVLRLPDGVPAGPDAYARLRLTATSATPGRAIPEIAIRQFDLQPVGSRALLGFGAGWHEAEADPATGRMWRWTSERSLLRIEAVDDVTLIIRGESPMKYFDAPPTVRVSAGSQVLAEFRPDADFVWRIVVPAAVLTREGGTIVLSTDKVYRPGEAEGTADARRLGLRVFACEIARDP
jgi:hypothetical protein